MTSRLDSLWQALPLRVRIAYAVGHVLNDLCASMWFTYLLIYFNLVLKFNPAKSGLILLIGQVTDGFATPLVGYFMDRKNLTCFNYGNLKIWHFIGTILVICSFPFVFARSLIDFNNTFGTWKEIVYYSFFIMIFQIGWATVQVSHLSLIPRLSLLESERNLLNTWRYCFTLLSNIFVFGLVWFSFGDKSIDDKKIGPQDSIRFEDVVKKLLLVGIVTSISFHSQVTDRSDAVQEINETNENTLTLDNIFAIFSDKNLYFLAANYTTTRLFVNIFQIYTPLLLHETLKLNVKTLAIVPLAIYIISFLSAFGAQSVNSFFGKKLSYAIGSSAGITSAICIYLVESKYALDIYYISILIGMANSFMLVTSLNLIADLIGTHAYKSSFVYGLMSFFDKISNGVGVVIIQSLHNSSDEYYRYVLTYVCGLSAVIGLISALLFRKQTEEEIIHSNSPINSN